MNKDSNMNKEYIGVTERFYNDVINAENNIRMINGKSHYIFLLKHR